MPLPRCPAGAVEINRGVRPPEYATPHPALSCTPAGCRPPLSLSVFSPPPSPAPLRGAGERRYTLTNQGLHPRLSASRPCGACPLLLLRLCSGQALHERGDRLFRQPPAPRAIPSRLPPQSRAALPAAVSRRGSAETFSLHLGFIWGSMRTTSPDI